MRVYNPFDILLLFRNREFDAYRTTWRRSTARSRDERKAARRLDAGRAARRGTVSTAHPTVAECIRT